MALSSLSSQRRRLPVFFLLDTSQDMAGTFQVTMTEGIQLLKSELERIQRGMTAPLIYLSLITLAEQSRQVVHLLKAPRRFEPPTWHAEGRCEFKTALEELRRMFEHDLIKTQPASTGDHNPLIFMVLGSAPSDAWKPGLTALAGAFIDNRRPRIITLVTKQRLVADAKSVSDVVLLLRSAEAKNMTRFFFWAIDAIVRVGENYRTGATKLVLPPLPDSIIAQ